MPKKMRLPETGQQPARNRIGDADCSSKRQDDRAARSVLDL